MTTKKRWVACPTCKTLVPHGEEDFPFCSERCKMIDLGRWASDSYRIPDPDCHD